MPNWWPYGTEPQRRAERSNVDQFTPFSLRRADYYWKQRWKSAYTSFNPTESLNFHGATPSALTAEFAQMSATLFAGKQTADDSIALSNDTSLKLAHQLDGRF